MPGIIRVAGVEPALSVPKTDGLTGILHPDNILWPARDQCKPGGWSLEREQVFKGREQPALQFGRRRGNHASKGRWYPCVGALR